METLSDLGLTELQLEIRNTCREIGEKKILPVREKYDAEGIFPTDIAKDFADCVVYIGNDSVTVAVPAPSEGLSEEAVARITDIICSETEYAAAQLNIIEVRA